MSCLHLAALVAAPSGAVRHCAMALRPDRLRIFLWGFVRRTHCSRAAGKWSTTMPFDSLAAAAKGIDVNCVTKSVAAELHGDNEIS